MTQVYKIQVSMNQAHLVESGLVFKQGDFGFQLEIEVLDFDVTGATPQIIFRKSSGAVESTAVSVSSNKFTYTMHGTELDVPGYGICDLKLKNSTTQRISTASFRYYVEADTMDGLNEQANSYSDTIEQIVDEALFGHRTINLFNKDDPDILENGFLNASNEFTAHPSFNESGYIECSYKDTPESSVNQYTFSALGALLGSSRPICFYDEDKNFIAGYALALPTITMQNPTAKYMRIPVQKTEMDTLMAVKNNSTLQPYVPYLADGLIVDINGIQDEVESIKKPYDTVKMVTFGDSIMYNDGKTINGEVRKGYPSFLREIGFNVTNEGVSGACVAYHSDRPYDDNVQTVDGITFSNYEYVLLEGGVNDYICSTPMGSIIDSGTFDKTTFYGAYQYIFDKILNAKPTMKIIIMSPLRTYITAYDVTNGGPNSQGKYLKDYRDAIENIAKHYAVPFIDLYNLSGLNSYDITSYTDDKLHPNNAGYVRANNIVVPAVRNMIAD